jgi:hypothetical protein
MDKKSIAALIVLIAGAGAAFAQSTNQAGQGRSDANPTALPTISPSDREAQNPLVNPGAAATQMKWKGYGSTSGAVTGHRVGSDNSARHYGPDDQGSVTPGAGMPLIAPSPSPPAARATNPGEARERLRQLGYSHIVELHQLGQTGWEAFARKADREVRVTLDTEGIVTGEHSLGRARRD